MLVRKLEWELERSVQMLAIIHSVWPEAAGKGHGLDSGGQGEARPAILEHSLTSRGGMGFLTVFCLTYELISLPHN